MRFLALVLLLTACAPLEYRHREGRVEVILADPWATAKTCAAKTGNPRAVGCHEATLKQTPDARAVEWDHVIRCPYPSTPQQLAECFAHEGRHLRDLEAGKPWRH